MISDHARTVPDLTSRPLEWNPPRTAISRVPYLPGLDGMRALAVMAVMVYHANHDWLGGGFIGVEVFFVISGYLITLLLIGEHEKSGRIDLKNFWFRRARRLLPALFVMMSLLVVYCSLFKRDELGNIRGDIIAGITYVSNWYQIWVGQGYTSTADFAPLRHLWSLAVEEQFYLVWPLVMVGLISMGRRRLPSISRWLVLASVLVTVLMAVLFYPGLPSDPAASWHIGDRAINKNDALYLSTITRSSGLLLGAAFAMIWRPVAVMRGPMRHKGRQLDLLGVVGLLGLGVLAWWLTVVHDDGSGNPYLFRGGFLVVGICTIMLMSAVTHRGAVTGPLLGNPVLLWIGIRSYGLYLYHWPIYQIIRGTAGEKLNLAEFAFAMVLTVAITEASYRFIETPIRKQQVGRWWRLITEQRNPRPRQFTILGGAALAAALVFGIVSMVGAKVEGNDVDQILEAGEGATTNEQDVLNNLTSTTLSVGPAAAPGTTVVAPGTTVAATAATPTTTVAGATTTAAPVAAGDGLLAIGDSVMKGAAPDLQELGFTVVAEESRQFDAEVDFVDQIAASGNLPEVVVVHLGTNGTISDSDATEFFSALQDVPIVLALTIWGPNKPWIEPNNELIRSLPNQFPNVMVGNWDVFAPDCQQWADSQGMTHACYASDGYHLGANGAEYYSTLIDNWVTQRKQELGLA